MAKTEEEKEAEKQAKEEAKQAKEAAKEAAKKAKEDAKEAAKKAKELEKAKREEIKLAKKEGREPNLEQFEQAAATDAAKAPEPPPPEPEPEAPPEKTEEELAEEARLAAEAAAEAERLAAEEKAKKELEKKRKDTFAKLSGMKVTPLDLDPEEYSQAIEDCIEIGVAELGAPMKAEIEAAKVNLVKAAELTKMLKEQSEFLIDNAKPAALDIDCNALAATIKTANAAVDKRLAMEMALQMATKCASIGKAEDCPEAEFGEAIKQLEEAGVDESVRGECGCRRCDDG